VIANGLANIEPVNSNAANRKAFHDHPSTLPHPIRGGFAIVSR
jgi:hypothetical protein